jgi:arylformamidase
MPTFGRLSPEEREREYSPSSCIGGDYRPFVAAYRERSDAARAALAWQRLAYGSGAAQGIELALPPERDGAAPVPLLVFIHGGYWQELAAADSLFAAPACVQRGVAFAAIDYTLAPAATVAQIADECRAAFALLVQRAPALGIDAARIVVAGSSAGAHLAAMVGLGPVHGARPATLVLVSGVYWLDPLVGTSINAALGLDAASARAASPGMLPLDACPPALVAWGEIETGAFKAQSRAFAALLAAAGRPSPTLEVPGRNHFDVILDLADPATPLGRRTWALLQPSQML